MRQHEFQQFSQGGNCTYREDSVTCGHLEDAPVHIATKMTTEHERHLRWIQKSFHDQVGEKYRAGVKQHGGKLWTKPGLIEKAMEECVDQYTFLYTLKMQRDDPKLIDPDARDIDE